MNPFARSGDGISSWVYFLSGLLLLGAALLLFSMFHHYKAASSVAPSAAVPSGKTPSLPNAQLTPGDVLTTDVQTVCVPGYTQTVRNVPSAVKEQVYRAYGITSHQPGEYEVDHLISLELGGSNSVHNLWPESYISKPLNAHIKDVLEDKLHALVCAGKLPIQTAQKAIAQNWLVAYQKYVGRLPSR